MENNPQRTTFGALPVGAKFKLVNRVSGQVLSQEWCEKTAPGFRDNRAYNTLQPVAATWRGGGRRVFSILLRDSDPVELPSS